MRELIGQPFTLTSVRKAETRFGPAYYLDIEREAAGTPKREVIGALESSPIGSQCALYPGMLTVGGIKWTIVQRESKKLKDESGNPQPIYLLACFELPEVDA